MTDRSVDVQSPRKAGRLFLKWAKDPASCPDPDDAAAELANHDIVVKGFSKAKVIFDDENTIHFVVRLDSMYQHSVDTHINNPASDYKLHPETRDLYSRYFDNNPSNNPTKREMFEMRIGEYCIGLCM